MGDFIDSEPEALELKVDNMSAISLSKNHVFHDRSKHIYTRYQFIRECIERNRIVIKHVSTEKQLADMLTKALGRVCFQELRTKIGVIHITRNSVKV